MKRHLFTKKEFEQINRMYWEEGYDQYDIAEELKCNQTTISRILTGRRLPREVIRKIKQEKYKKNFKAPPEELPRVRKLRCKREELHSTKLTLEKAKSIRKSYFSGEKTQVELAKANRINQSTVCKLIMGENWKICKC